MALNVHVLTASGHLRPYKRAIRSSLNAAWPAVDAALNLGTLDVVVSHAPATDVLPEGFTPNGHVVYMYLYSERSDVDDLIVVRLPQTLAHEAHHARRWRGPGYGTTLADALITEGLAQHFERELTRDSPVSAPPLDVDEAKAVAAPLEADLTNPKYDHPRWFLSEGNDGFPRWAGYRIGYRVIAQYLAHHSGETAASLRDAGTEVFESSLREVIAEMKSPTKGLVD